MPGSFLDSNVVLYNLSKEENKHEKALHLLAAGSVISTQVLGEVANVMRRSLLGRSTAWAATRKRVDHSEPVSRFLILPRASFTTALFVAIRPRGAHSAQITHLPPRAQVHRKGFHF
jgi:predicted nucleic acid-binding protein